jgi:hypothetical protein
LLSVDEVGLPVHNLSYNTSKVREGFLPLGRENSAMNMKIWRGFLVGVLLLTVAGCKEETPPRLKMNFVCEAGKNGIPTTYALTPIGKKPVIRWVSKYFEGSGYTPQRRCEEVTQKMQTAENNGVLNFITVGRENNQDVLCFSTAKGGKCDITLLTLKPDDSASKLIEDIFNINNAGGPIEQSSGQPYIDFEKWVKSIPSEK